MAKDVRSGEDRPWIVLVPFPAQGHVTPLIHLAAALSNHGFRVVMALPESIHRRLPSATVAGAEITISSISDGFLAGGADDFFSLNRAMEEIMPLAFEALLRNLLVDGHIAGVIVDMVASWGIDVAERFSLPTAGFWPAWLAVHELVSSSLEMVRRGLISPSGIPLAGRDNAVVFSGAGGLELTASDLPWLVGDLPSQKGRFTFWQRAIERWAKLRWVIANSFSGVDEFTPVTRVFRVAPLPAMEYRCNFWEEDMSCLSWLDSQKPGSVVYVSFGSWVPPISGDLIAELAAGLHSSGRPFLWVAPVPSLASSSLPSSSTGMVLRWVAQKEVLEHAAVGSFLTHCGWNSTMEAIRFRKPMLCYPIAGDQFANCKQIVQTWKVGVKLHEMRCRAVVEGLAALMGPGGGAAMRRRLDALSEEVIGGGGVATATAELLAIVNELRDVRT